MKKNYNKKKNELLILFSRPLFPGKHYIEQINLILNVVGSPDEADLVSIGMKIFEATFFYSIQLNLFF